MLIIRLSRVGRKNDPSFRIVLQEKHRAPTGKVIEFLGFYNSRLKQKSFKEERIKYWLGEGAQASDTVHNLLVSAKIINKPKRKATTVSNKKRKKGEKEQKSAEPKIKEEKDTENKELKEEKTESVKKEEPNKSEEKQIIKKDNTSEKKKNGSKANQSQEEKEEQSKIAK